MEEERKTDVSRLLREMHPLLHETPVVFCIVRPEDLAALPFEQLGIFQEAEGTTVIAPAGAAERAGLPCSERWAHITLQVHSSLSAVGFIAAVAGVLARAGIAVNPVSAFHHDHLFVQWERREEAMAVLKELESVGKTHENTI
jgi:hypothetical protein